MKLMNPLDVTSGTKFAGLNAGASRSRRCPRVPLYLGRRLSRSGRNGGARGAAGELLKLGSEPHSKLDTLDGLPSMIHSFALFFLRELPSQKSGGKIQHHMRNYFARAFRLWKVLLRTDSNNEFPEASYGLKMKYKLWKRG